MKRKFAPIFVLAAIALLSLVFAACEIYNPDVAPCKHVDVNTDGKCDICGETIGECTHVDADGNGICDVCTKSFVCKHADDDNDKICDNCGRNVVAQLTIYAINDLHGMYVDTDTQPGVDELTTYLLDAQRNGNAVVLSSGDMWQGSSESNNTKGKLATEWLNYVNCASMTLGNHEFDWSTDKIKSNEQLAEFPFLAINVYEHATNKRATYCDASTVVNVGGLRVGIIGAIGDCYSSISASMCTDVYFKTGNELTSLVKAEATKLREEKDVDYVVYSIHDGNRGAGDYYDVALSDGYVDVVFEGHTHQAYTYTDVHGVKHVQGGGYNQAISQATVNFNLVSNVKNTNVGVVYNDVYSRSESNDIVNRLVEKYRDEIGTPDEIVGYNEANRESDELRSIMAKAYLQTGEQNWGEKYDIVLAGGYISVRDPYSLPAGNVTIRQIQTLFPFDNEMHLCSIKGSDLLNRYFNNKSYVYQLGAVGETVANKLRSGSGLNDTYYIVTDSYNTDYAYNRLTKVQSLGNDFFPRDCFVEYVKNGNLGETQTNENCDNHADKNGDLKCDNCGEYVVKVYSVGEALNLASRLANGEETASINVVGTIDSLTSADYGNCYIKDEYGNSIYVFGIWGKNNVKYSSLSYKPQAGDTVVLSATIKNYNGTVEVYQGVLLWTTQTAQG